MATTDCLVPLLPKLELCAHAITGMDMLTRELPHFSGTGGHSRELSSLEGPASFCAGHQEAVVGQGPSEQQGF